MRAGIYGRIPARVHHFSYFSFLSGDQGRNSCIFAGLTFRHKQLRRNTVDLQHFRLLIIRCCAEQCALCRGGSEPSQDRVQACVGVQAEACGIAATTKKHQRSKGSAVPKAPQYRKSAGPKVSAVPKAPQGQKLHFASNAAETVPIRSRSIERWPQKRAVCTFRRYPSDSGSMNLFVAEGHWGIIISNAME